MKTTKNIRNAIIIENQIFDFSAIASMEFDNNYIFIFLKNSTNKFYFPVTDKKAEYYLNLYKSIFDKVYE